MDIIADARAAGLPDSLQTSPPFSGFFESQKDAQCGLHALNNAIGFKFLSVHLMQSAAVEYVAHAAREGLFENLEDHVTESGEYSEAVMAFALQWHQNIYCFDLNAPILPNENSLLRLYGPDVLGVIVNKIQHHWVTFKVVNDEIWLLDSLFQPQRVTFEYFSNYVYQYPRAYLVCDIS